MKRKPQQNATLVELSRLFNKSRRIKTMAFFCSGKKKDEQDRDRTLASTTRISDARKETTRGLLAMLQYNSSKSSRSCCFSAIVYYRLENTTISGARMASRMCRNRGKRKEVWLYRGRREKAISRRAAKSREGSGTPTVKNWNRQFSNPHTRPHKYSEENSETQADISKLIPI